MVWVGGDSDGGSGELGWVGGGLWICVPTETVGRGHACARRRMDRLGVIMMEGSGGRHGDTGLTIWFVS
jgi:hypothetical protein